MIAAAWTSYTRHAPHWPAGRVHCTEDARVGQPPPARGLPIREAGPHNQTDLSPSDVTHGENGRERAVPGEAVSPSPPLASAPGARAHGFTLEAALYGLILVAALLTRFWDLGSRALHHDESLHAYFSWLLATGQNYVHDPLMHGPFLFHFNALIYALIGASDASTRFSAALFGVILVMLPVLLRGERQLGRWGALTASTLILISPALLYQSRYMRHDIFTLVGTLFLFIAIVHYVERPSRGWLVAAGATLGFLVTNHEIIFGIAAVFVAMIAGALLWGPLRRLIPLLLVSGLAAIALIVVLPGRTRPLPHIPWSSPTQGEQYAFYRDLLTHPLIVMLALLSIVTVAAAGLILRWRPHTPNPAPSPWQGEESPSLTGEGSLGGTWEPLLFGDDPPAGSVAAAVRGVWRDHTGVSWALIAGLVIFATLFTTLFTNLYGLASGTIATDGTLLYWLGQHNVQRGEQPWFYYLVLLPQYELIAALFGGLATLVFGIRAILVGIGRVQPGPRFFVQTFLAAWFCGILLILSWAGEKMPWLVTHISLPATLLAAALLGEAWRRWRPVVMVDGRPMPAPGWGGLQWGLFAALVALAVCWFLVAAPLTYGEFVSGSFGGGWERAPTAWALEHWWLLALPPLAAIVAIVVTALRSGLRLAAEPALAALVLVLALAEIHIGWRLIYQEGDVPKDMLVYTQTSPDVQRMVHELTTLSELTTGGKDLEIWYDDNNGVSWPMQWYLRDFPNRHLYGGAFSGPPDNVPIVLVGGDNLSSVEPYLEGYTAQRYVLRWWFPESIYRDFAIAPEISPHQSAWGSSQNPHDLPAIARSILDSLATLGTPDGQQRLYRLVMYRDLPTRIDSYDYTLFVRNDLLPLYNQIRYRD